MIIDVDGRAVETNVTSTLPTNDTAIRNSQQEAEKQKDELNQSFFDVGNYLTQKPEVTATKMPNYLWAIVIPVG